MAPNESRYRVQSLDRAIDALEVIKDAGKGLTVTEVAAQIGASKSATFATLYTLVERGFVISDGQGAGRVYRLGFALALLGHHALAQTSLRDAAMPFLRSLTEQTGLSSRVAAYQNDAAVIVGQVDAPGQVRFDLKMGDRELLHCTGVGKAILAQLPDSRVGEIVSDSGLPRRTSRTITDVDDLIASLAEVRQRGYAVDREEDAEGIVCIGAPVWDHRRSNVGAISATGLRVSMQEKDIHRLGEAVRSHAQRLSRHLEGL
ncbi:IclR family transcriptional regulator [Nocardia australiensis]|uniref:IclR family transcriptional regulator n=1 Tax=Nocardia australiensis TaxID=2887191 RepID=UPI001D15C418|nr:IclR family transcriptional regulator [Nocardia australiensis]